MASPLAGSLLAMTLFTGITCSDPGTTPSSPTTVAPAPWSSRVGLDQLSPYVLFEGQATTIVAHGQEAWGQAYTVQQGGSTVAVLSLYTDEAELVLELLVEEAGAFQYALYLESPRLRTLDVHTTDYISGNELHYYPYDWTHTWTDRWAHTELISPGVLVHDPAGAWVAVAHQDTQLFKVDLRTSGSDKQARFFRQIESASGVDRTLVTQVLQPGDRDQLRLTTADSVREIQRRRLGAARVIRGLMTQVPHRGWGSDQGYLSAASYQAIATRLAEGQIEHVQLRLNEPEQWVSDIFTQEGLTTHYYMFLGVARLRRVDGVHCYSIRFEDGDACVDGTQGAPDWMLRDANGDAYTPAVNPTWAFVDLRVDAYRQAFVDRATRAVERGFGGIFFDGPHLWTGASRDVFTVGATTTTRVTVPGDGAIGGVNGHNIAMSWYNARSLLLREVRDEVRALDDNAYVGMLGNEYTDYQAAADYVLKEVTYWVDLADDPRCRVLDYTAMGDALMQPDFAALYGFYAPQRVLGVKGNDPHAINQIHEDAAAAGVGSHQHGLPTQVKYIGVADFTGDAYVPDYTIPWADTIKNVASIVHDPATPPLPSAACP